MIGSSSAAGSGDLQEWEENLDSKIRASSHIRLDILTSPTHHDDQDETDSDGADSRPCYVETALTTIKFVVKLAGKHNLCGPFDHSAILSALRRRCDLGGDQFEFCQQLGRAAKERQWGEVFECIISDMVVTDSHYDTLRRAAVEMSVDHWNDEYAGEAVRALMETFHTGETMTGADWEAQLYSKTLDILQSSGTGKSRLIRNAGDSILSISFALRLGHEAGFPPGDPEIFRFLMGGNKSAKNCHSRVIAFLGAFLATFTSWHEQKSKLHGSPTLEVILC